MAKKDLIILIVLAVVVISQATWIFLDAKKRGEKQYLIWGILGLIQVPTSLIVYLIVTRSIFNKTPCKGCGKAVNMEMAVCPYCGNSMKKACPGCGTTIEDDWQFCPKCRKKLID